MPEIPHNERLIVVLGMARSGTTIFTYVLCRHPQIALFRGGPEAWLLENHCLLRRQRRRIGRVASLFPHARFVVLKRPWQEEHAEWLHEHLPHARFIVLLRDREAIKRSWATTGRWALSGRQQALTDPDACYDAYFKHAMRLPEVVGSKQCRIIRYERMLQEPTAVFEELADWLGVERCFDCTPIGSGLHWRRELAEEFPRGDVLLDGPKPAHFAPAAAPTGQRHVGSGARTKLALVTLSAGDNFERMAALVNPPKERYCNRFGYDFIPFQGLLDPGRPAAWSKLLAVQRVLPAYDWVLWCDTDAVLWNPEIGLRQFIAAAGEAAVIMQCNRQGINSGLFFVRNCTWAFEFLEEVYKQERFINHGWWEQAAIAHLLKRQDVRSHFKIYPYGEPRGGFHGFYRDAEWDTVFIHLAGGRGTKRVRLVENLVRLAKLPTPLRMRTRGELGSLLNRLGLFGDGVEIGVASGEFSKSILDTWEGRRLHLVDAWRHRPDYIDIVSDKAHQGHLRSVPERLAAHQGRYEIHRALSRDAVATFANGSLDFAYIDADHSFDAVREDLRLWYPKVRSRGIVAGHDFVDGELPEGRFGVRQAVLEFERDMGLRVAVTAERDWPSWYFIKP